MIPTLLTRPSSLVVSLATALLLAGCGGESTSPGSSETTAFPDDPWTTQASDAGALTIEVRTSPKQPPERGLTVVQLSITDGAGDPMDDLVVTAVPWMPDMGHGASVKPTVTNAGGGKYEIDNVNMFMPGRWELRTEMTGPLDDSAKFVFQIP